MLEQQLRERTTAIPLEIAEANGGDAMEKGGFARVIEAAHVVADEGRTGLQRWVDAGRRAGLSWAEVGEALGVSKQAAQQRFGAAADALDEAPGEMIVRFGATAFNEERILEAEGSKGRELVRIGPLSLAFRATGRVWEYRRVIAISKETGAAKLQGDGWAHVSNWGLFQYFKRPGAPLSGERGPGGR